MSKLDEFARLQAAKQGQKPVIPLVREYLQKRHSEDSDRNPWVVHPSEMAKKDWCERATFHRISSGVVFPESFNFTLQAIFDEGHQIHDKWQQWLRGTGELWGDWRCELCNAWQHARAARDLLCAPCALGPHGERIPHQWHYEEVGLTSGIISGHEDGAVYDRLIEIKSVGLGTLRHDAPGVLAKFYRKTVKCYDLDGLWAALKQPLASHVRQANVYMYLAQQMGGEYGRFSQASIVYEFKPNQQSKEFSIRISDEILDPLLERLKPLEAGRLPACPYGGCKKCRPYDEAAAKARPRLVWSSPQERAGAR